MTQKLSVSKKQISSQPISLQFKVENNNTVLIKINIGGTKNPSFELKYHQRKLRLVRLFAAPTAIQDSHWLLATSNLGV